MKKSKLMTFGLEIFNCLSSYAADYTVNIIPPASY